MKIIFLDFDGVINSGPFLRARDKADTDHRWENSIDPKAVALLNLLIDKTGAKVVVSSSWRVIHNAKALQGFLNFHGFQGEVIGTTPNGVYLNGQWGDRGDEIQKWMDDYGLEIESFVILDDDSDMANLMSRLINTKYEIGLLPEHVECAIELLGEK